MKKETAKKIEEKVTFPELMQKYDASFSLEVDGGFAHVKFIARKMYVQWLNEEGYSIDNEDIETPFEAVKKVADFMAELKTMKLEDYSKLK